MIKIINFGIGIICFLFAQNDFADWIGPSQELVGSWGNGIGQFGFVNGEPTDGFPTKIMVDKNNNIIVQDLFNKRVQIYKPNGKIVFFSYKELNPGWEIMQWPSDISNATGVYNNIFVEAGFGKYQYYDYQGNITNQFKVDDCILKQVNEDGSLIVMNYKTEKYYCYSPTGQLLKSYDTRPLELGIVKESSLGNSKYEATVEYPDYAYKVSAAVGKYSRDMYANLYDILYAAKRFENEAEPVICYTVIRVDRCTGTEYVFELPRSEYAGFSPQEINAPAPRQEIKIEYGEPIVSPLGDLYCWARTKTHYKILKWTWQGPQDAPQSLKISSGVAGLKLNWAKPVKDAETVTGYQILRSAEVCGPFNEVVMVKKDKLTFEDTTIKPPWKYYYVVKAVRDKKYSGESNKVYMQWK